MVDPSAISFEPMDAALPNAGPKLERTGGADASQLAGSIAAPTLCMGGDGRRGDAGCAAGCDRGGVAGPHEASCTSRGEVKEACVAAWTH